MERLNHIQLRILKERHPDSNKTTFFEHVSKIILTPTADQFLVQRINDRHELCASVVFKNN
jgi:hypothetical protein